MKFITNIFICLFIALTTNLACISESASQVTTKEEVANENTKATDQTEDNIKVEDGSQTETVAPFTVENY